ncbi:MAG: hypothetical protein V1747_01995 [Candidatus Omnitrophota bacterium]
MQDAGVGVIKSHKKCIMRIAVVVFAVLICFNAQSYLLFNKYAVHEDTRESIIWMAHLADSELFRGDLHLVYENWKIPIGLKAFYYVSGRFFNPLAVVKILPFFLGAISALFAYHIGCYLKNNTTGLWVSFLVTLSAWYTERSFAFSDVWFGEGGAGAFHPVLLLMFIFYFLKKDYLKTGIVMIAQVFIYPPLFIISALTYPLSATRFSKKSLSFIKNRKIWIVFSGVILVAVCLIAPKYFNPPDELGPVFNLSEMKQMAEFSSKGRLPVFYDSFFQSITNYRSGLGLDRAKTGLFFAACLLVILMGKKAFKIRSELWILLLCGLFLFCLARIFMLKLFEPERYMRYTFLFVLIIFVSLNIQRLISNLTKNPGKRAIIHFSLSLFVLFAFLPYLQNAYSFSNKADKGIKLYEFLGKTPKDTFIAAHPEVMDDITVFALRKGLIMQEADIPYQQKYYAQISKRTYDFFTAYYAASKQEIYKLSKTYKLDYIVVDREHFTAEYLESDSFYFAPYNEFIGKIINNNKKQRFALLEFPDSKIVFKDKKYIVIDAKKIVADFENLNKESR